MRYNADMDKNVLELCYYQRKSKVFEDLSITGKVYITYTTIEKNDIYGRPVVEKFNWDDVLFLPHEEDLSDCDGFVKNGTQRIN